MPFASPENYSFFCKHIDPAPKNVFIIPAPSFLSSRQDNIKVQYVLRSQSLMSAACILVLDQNFNMLQINSNSTLVLSYKLEDYSQPSYINLNSMNRKNWTAKDNRIVLYPYLDEIVWQF